MSEYLFNNNAVSTLASSINTTDVSLFLQTGDGALFPSPGSNQIFTVTLAKSDGTKEVCQCTARSGDTLTVTRAQEGTTAVAFASGDIVSLRLTKGALDNYAQRDVTHEWTKSQNFNAVVLTDQASIAWNLETQQVASVVLAGNRTLANPTNMKDGMTAVLTVKQDATGSRTLAYGSAYEWPSGLAPVLSTAANAVDIFSFVCDGSKMRGVINKAFA